MTTSYEHVFTPSLLGRFKFAETRNAAEILAATSPSEFADIQQVLAGFRLTTDLVTRPGGSRSIISRQLDEAFRELGWREVRFEQKLETTLHVFPWRTDEAAYSRMTSTDYEGHKVDNVKGSAALDVEWNPKDGNLDRDLANYTALYDAGIINVGVLVIRSHELRYRVRDVIKEVKETTERLPFASAAWTERMRKLPNDPFGTSTTANFEKLEPRLRRGDARGCPILAVGIGTDAWASEAEDVADFVVAQAQQQADAGENTSMRVDG
ncbi:MAG: BglII/BstYI family type II restriction endonuclease [Corynebacterium sp.]|nr:BglII/BstYI family type II restriction endonuclease [Corynebacterium sp.]